MRRREAWGHGDMMVAHGRAYGHKHGHISIWQVHMGMEAYGCMGLHGWGGLDY